MERMPHLGVGDVVEGLYRIEALVSESDRAQVYAVTHARFPDARLALKVASLAETPALERDTNALATLTSANVVRVFDRGKLPDGRGYRVVERLAGPSLREAIASRKIERQRAQEILSGLSAVLFEAHMHAIGPCDLSPENLMFLDGVSTRICLLRALLDPTRAFDPALDQAALNALGVVLEGPSNKTPTIPPISAPPEAPLPTIAQIGRWTIGRTISTTARATIYEVTDEAGTEGALKLAGPATSAMKFAAHAELLARIKSPHVVSIFEVGQHEEAPFVVMERLSGMLADRVKSQTPPTVEDALKIADDMLVAAEAVSAYSTEQPDFSLEHCFESSSGGSPCTVLTHVSPAPRTPLMILQNRMPGSVAWQAAVAVYQLLARRSPFPVSKESLARIWMGPVALHLRRGDVPLQLSQLVSDAIASPSAYTAAQFREALAGVRAALPSLGSFGAPPFAQPSLSPQQRSVSPQPSSSPKQSVAITYGLGPQPSVVPRSVSVPKHELRVTSSRCPIALSAAAIGDDAEIVGIGRGAVARYREGQWSVEPAGEATDQVRTIAPIGNGEYLATTWTGSLLRLGPKGALTPRGVALDRYGFHNAARSNQGLTLVGGTTGSTPTGVIARLVGESITILADRLGTGALLAAAHLPDGSLVAAGAGGFIIHLREDAVEVLRPCEVDLLAVHVAGPNLPLEAFVVGRGAWAFRVTFAPLTATLEPVDTQSSLSCLTADANGEIWAGSTKGRILRRRQGHWRRMSDDFIDDPPVLCLRATDRVRALLADGHLVAT